VSVKALWPDFRQAWVLYQDEDLIAVDKPAGVPSQAADPAHDDDLVSRLKRWLAAQRGVEPEQVYLGVHQRLDRDTSGVIVYSLRREANPELARQFEGRSVQKRYLAAVEGLRDLRGERVLEHRLARARDGRMTVLAADAREGHLARTRVRTAERAGQRVLLELGCDTGRTHQLRVQLAHIGAAIAGDRLYGGAPALRLMLHAHRLALQHPRDGRALELVAPPPLELSQWLQRGAVDAMAEPTLLRRALQLAIESRYRLGRARAAAEPTTAFRLFHGIAEGAPELAIDMYGDHLVAHLRGSDPVREREVLAALQELEPLGIYVKRHARQKNELGDARDSAWAPAAPSYGAAAPEELVVYEHGLPFGVRLGEGLRTGLFLDQRDNRRRVRERASGKRVLNLFAYTGGFSLAALAGGASEVISIDASATALAWAERNCARLGAADRHRGWHADVFEALARLARKHERFDLIVLDPPSYAKTRRRRFIAERHYAELCQAALALLAKGGSLLACINHHGISRAKLRRDLRSAAAAAQIAIASLKDLGTQLDFPAPHRAEPLAKSALLTSE
jgi:23S rRNA (cytosine1962-C5)-methyltransferase